MKLPNRERAFVPAGKLKDYLLSPNHPVGRHKAAYFVELGFTVAEPAALERELLKVAQENAVIETIPGEFGTKYIVEGQIHAPSGRRAVLVTVWLIPGADERPRLITAYRGRARDLDKGAADDS